MKKKICCYCGINQATTRDHIPPKSIFDTSAPINLITVPSCLECNNNAANDDEVFKANLLMHCAKENESTSHLFKTKALPTIIKNNKIKQEILRNSKPVRYFDKNKKRIETGMAVSWNSEAHDAVIERITRGLFYYHYKEILPHSVIIKTYWFNQTPDIFKDLLYKNIVGKDAFVYSFEETEESKFYSIWLYQFYNSHFAGAIVLEE